MSFGWSVGDIIAGIKVVRDIWEAVSDGALSAPVEATQFLEDFAHIISCLEDWELRARSTQDANISDSYRRHQQLREECITFIRRHRRLIQEVNPQTKTIKEGHTSWLRKARFTQEQIISLYEKTQWPFERKEVARLQDRLQRYLQTAIYRVSALTNEATLQTMEMVRDMRYLHLLYFANSFRLILISSQSIQRQITLVQSETCFFTPRSRLPGHSQFEKGHKSSRVRCPSEPNRLPHASTI